MTAQDLDERIKDRIPVCLPLEAIDAMRHEADAIDRLVLAAMKRKNLNQKELAEKLGVSGSVITKLRSGQSNVPMGKLLKLIKISGSVAIIQWYARQCGYVLVKSKELEDLRRDKERKDDLESRMRLINRATQS